MRIRRSAVATLLFVLGLFFVPVCSLYFPCPLGSGLDDPDKYQPGEKECRPCDIEGCSDCTWDATRCRQCPAFSGPAGPITDDGAPDCKKCTSSKCAVCSDGYKKKCTGKVRSCPNRIRKTRPAKRTTVKAIRDSANQSCWNKSHLIDSDGYISLKLYNVDKKGRCIECQDEQWWRPLEYGTNYCWFYEQSLRVMANAFTETNCPFPSSIKAKLVKQCMTDNRSISFFIRQKFRYDALDVWPIWALSRVAIHRMYRMYRMYRHTRSDITCVCLIVCAEPSTVGRKRLSTSWQKGTG